MPCLDEPGPDGVVAVLVTSFLTLFAFGGGVRAGSVNSLFCPAPVLAPSLPVESGGELDSLADSGSKLMGLGGGSLSTEGAMFGPCFSADGGAVSDGMGGTTSLSRAGVESEDISEAGLSCLSSVAACLSVRFSRREEDWEMTAGVAAAAAALPFAPAPASENPNGRGGPDTALDSKLTLTGVMRLRPSDVRDSICLVTKTGGPIAPATAFAADVGGAVFPLDACTALSCKASSSGSSISICVVWLVPEEEVARLVPYVLM